jgi:hypothetical protein
MMWLFADTVSDEWSQKGTGPTTPLEQMAGALNALKNPETTLRGLTEIDDSVKKLQKTMGGGIVLESSNFREQLMASYEGVLKMGGKFEDITNAVEGLSDGMEKVVYLTNAVVDSGERIVRANGQVDIVYRGAAESMVALAKSTNMTEKEVGGMVSSFMRLEGSQVKSIETMQKITKSARMSGVDSKKLLDEVKGSLGKIDSYGFKNGIEGMTKMAIQAQQLRTSVDDIGALSKSVDLWDPEKAIETAANMQMLGGAIGNLGSPFKLMNMGMNDVEALQNEMIDLAANAFKVNKETGEIDISNISRMRLKEQADAMGTSLENMTKIGREAKKSQEVISEISQTDFGANLPEDQKKLLASLTEFKGGKMILDLPNFNTTDLAQDIEKNPERLKQALEEYQKTAEKSDRQIAEKGLTLQESMDANTRIIRDSLLMSLEKTDKDTILNDFYKGVDVIKENFANATKENTEIAYQGTKGLLNNMNEKSKIEPMSDEKKEELKRNAIIKSEGKQAKRNKEGDIIKEEDAAFSTGNKVLSLGKGEMFNFIKEDEAVFAPNLLNNLDILKKTYEDSIKIKNSFEGNRSLANMKEMSTAAPSTTTKTESTQKIEASGNINININVTSAGTLSEALMKDRTFTQELKDRVMTIIKDKSKIGVEKGQVR